MFGSSSENQVYLNYLGQRRTAKPLVFKIINSNGTFHCARMYFFNNIQYKS